MIFEGIDLFAGAGGTTTGIEKAHHRESPKRRFLHSFNYCQMYKTEQLSEISCHQKIEGNMSFSLQEQIEEVEREITMREKVYPRQVMLKKMSQENSDQKISLMRAVLQTLKESQLREKELNMLMECQIDKYKNME